MSRLPRLVFVILCFTCGNPAFPQGGPFEPKIGDLIRDQVAGVIEAQQQLAAARGAAKAKYDAARERYFSTPPGSPAHKQAEKEFALLLQDKDYIYLGVVLNVGVEDGLGRAMGLGIISGGGDLLDNGIPKPALPAFGTWARGVRASLGAKSENQLLFVTDERAVKKALIDNEPAYLRYKKDRDRSEIRLWNVAHPREDQQPGNLPLSKSVTLRANEPEASAAFPQSLDGTVRQSVLRPGNQQRIIACTYGPALTSEGEDAFATYRFWHPTPPPDIKQLLAADEVNALHYVGDIGVATCPRTDGLALSTRQAAMKVTEAPEYVAMRAAARERKQQASREIGAMRDRVADDCTKLSSAISQTDTGISSDVSHQLRTRAFALACSFNDQNFAASAPKVSATPTGWCTQFKANVDSFWESSRGSVSNPKKVEIANDLKRSYDGYCGSSGDIMTGKAYPQGNGTAVNSKRVPDVNPAGSPSVTATSVPQAAQTDDPRLRMCLARQQNLEDLRAKASGFRDRLALSSMESAFKRDCAAILPIK